VLLLEGGGRDNWIWFHIPVGYLFAIGNPRADWLFKTAAEPGLNGRALAYPRGKVLGGSSAINAMIYMRGQARDYDGWRQMGMTGWGWDDVLPFFLRHEDHQGGDGLFHRSGGEWRVEHPRIRWAILDRLRDAAEQAGIARIDDFNTGDNSGSSYFQVNQKMGRRWSAARGFLKPALGRPNLRVETGAIVDRVDIEEGRARRIVYVKDGRRVTAAARGEIVLSAGAVASPVILERSGIGRPDILKARGVEPLVALPGVGENLQDHLQIRPIYKVTGIRTLNGDYKNLFRRAMMGVDYALRRRGPLTMAPSQMGAFVRTAPEYETANIEFHFQPLSLDNWGDGLHPFEAFTASVCNLRPTSRGSLHLSGPDAAGSPTSAPTTCRRKKIAASPSIR
jgi:choline dehydrogenase